MKEFTMFITLLSSTYRKHGNERNKNNKTVQYFFPSLSSNSCRKIGQFPLGRISHSWWHSYHSQTPARSSSTAACVDLISMHRTSSTSSQTSSFASIRCRHYGTFTHRGVVHDGDSAHTDLLPQHPFFCFFLLSSPLVSLSLVPPLSLIMASFVYVHMLLKDLFATLHKFPIRNSSLGLLSFSVCPPLLPSYVCN